MPNKQTSVHEAFILTYDPERTAQLPKKLDDDHQQIAFTNNNREYIMSRSSVFNALTSHDTPTNITLFGISNIQLQKAYDDTENRFEPALT